MHSVGKEVGDRVKEEGEMNMYLVGSEEERERRWISALLVKL